MRICVISSAYPTLNGKGGHFFVEEIVNQFAKMGHNCTVIAPINLKSGFFLAFPYGPYQEKRKTKDGNVIEIYRPRYYGCSVKINDVSIGRYFACKAVERTLKNKKIAPDILYCHFFRNAFITFRYALKNHIPLFVASGESVIPQYVKPFQSFSIQSFSKYVSGVICVSTKNKNEAISLGYVDASKCVVLPNGTNLNIFHQMIKSEARKELGLPLDKFIVICVGNFVERKGQDRLLKAINEIKNKEIGVILIGKGKLNETSNNILYEGFVNHNNIPIYLNASDVFVLPTKWEGCCNAIVEAMACGIPIISSNRSFNRDILDSDNSILVDPEDIHEISTAINLLFINKDLRIALGKRAYETSRNLSIENRAKNIINFVINKINNTR